MFHSPFSKGIRKDRSGFSIYLAIVMMILLVLIGTFLIEKLVPAAETVKGIEQ